MARNLRANDKVLFHLVPVLGNPATEVLSHPDNRRFVSLSAKDTPGLEIGFHVPRFSRGHVITKLGRDTDLILRKSYSAVHVAFEIHPETLVVMLSTRTKRVSSVKVALSDENREHKEKDISGDYDILYGQDYDITIASYEFKLVWRSTEGPGLVQSLKDLATRGYEDAMQRLKDVRSRDLSIPERSTANYAPLFTEREGCRVLVREGAFGKVYKTVDQASGKAFAVKVVNLKGQAGMDPLAARTALHREIKIMEKVSHAHIIECLGTKDLDTDRPLIFMPLRQGSLKSLVEGGERSPALYGQILDQMLRALDYLAFHNYCHRDVKPANILYNILGQDEYLFQLADFGFANDYRKAKTLCGTSFYQAPELYNGQPQTPKMDIWSLFVTIAEIVPEYNFPPETITSPRDIIQAVKKAAAAGYPQLQPMVRMDPMLRASAAQMLVAVFDGKGLTTPKNQIPPIKQEAPQPVAIPFAAQAAPRPAPSHVIDYVRRHDPLPPRPAPLPGILPNRLPQRPQVQQPIRAHRDGIRNQLALQARPREKLLQTMQVMQPQAEGIKPRVVNKPPQEKEPLAMQLKHSEEAPLPVLREAEFASNISVRAKAAKATEIMTPHLPGTFPESRRRW